MAGGKRGAYEEQMMALSVSSDSDGSEDPAVGMLGWGRRFNPLGIQDE